MPDSSPQQPDPAAEQPAGQSANQTAANQAAQQQQQPTAQQRTTRSVQRVDEASSTGDPNAAPVTVTRPGEQARTTTTVTETTEPPRP
jgi:hypothetical protein